MQTLESRDFYEKLTSYYVGLSSTDARLFDAGLILMLSNYVESQDKLFEILSEVKTLLFSNKGDGK